MKNVLKGAAVWFILAGAWFILWLVGITGPNASSSAYMFFVAIAFFAVAAAAMQRRPPRR
ncbi:MAG: hypothetical protein WKF94_08295 [Solirubrobacteraceae bacterium]